MKKSGSLIAAIVFIATAVAASNAKPDQGEKPKKDNDAPAFVTDRPDVSEGSQTTQRGMVQIELGLRQNQQPGGVKNYFIDDLIRIGIKERWELRVGGSAFAYTHSPTLRRAGTAPFYLGLKKNFAEAAGARPSMGWLLNLNLPAPGRTFNTGRVDGNVLFLLNKQLTEKADVEFNLGPGVNWDPAAGTYFRNATYALTVSYFPTKAYRFYGEGFGSVPGEKAGRASANAGFGLQWYNYARLNAIDLSVTTAITGLSRQTNRASLALGYSIMR